jgi:hypothetical protein
MLEPLRAAGVLIPAATVLKRIGLIAWVRARRHHQRSPQTPVRRSLGRWHNIIV